MSLINVTLTTTENHDVPIYDVFGLSEVVADAILEEVNTLMMADGKELPDELKCPVCLAEGEHSLDMSRLIKHLADKLDNLQQFSYAIFLCGVADEKKSFIKELSGKAGAKFISSMFGPNPSQS